MFFFFQKVSGKKLSTSVENINQISLEILTNFEHYVLSLSSVWSPKFLAKWNSEMQLQILCELLGQKNNKVKEWMEKGTIDEHNSAKVYQEPLMCAICSFRVIQFCLYTQITSSRIIIIVKN